MNTSNGLICPVNAHQNLLSSADVEIRHIMILTYMGCFLGDVIKLLEMLDSLNKNRPDLYENKIQFVIHINSLYGGQITSPSTTLVHVETQAVQIFQLPDIDIFIIADGPQQAISGQSDMVINWLSKICRHSRCVLTLGAGIFWLAATGVLDQRTVTTHSSLITILTEYYPALLVKRNTDFQKDGKFYTTSEHLNIQEIAQLLLGSDQGEDSNRHLSGDVLNTPPPGHSSCLLNYAFAHPHLIAHRVILWWLVHIDEDLSTTHSANFLAMSERSFRRHFKIQIGYSPSLFLLLLRLELSRQALINSKLPIDKIARRCGLLDGQQLARVFRRFIGISPHLYRKMIGKEKEFSLHHAYSDLFNAITPPEWLYHFMAEINQSGQQKQSILPYLQYKSIRGD